MLELWKLRAYGGFWNFLLFFLCTGSVATVLFIVPVFTDPNILTVCLAVLTVCIGFFLYRADYRNILRDTRESAGLCPRCGDEDWDDRFACNVCGRRSRAESPLKYKGLEELESRQPLLRMHDDAQR